MSTAPNPPHPRVIQIGSVGVDVVAVKRALSRAGYMAWGEFTTSFGSYMDMAMKDFQRDRSIQPTGLYGDGTHNALKRTAAVNKPGEWAFDATAVDLMRQEAAILALTPDQRVRQAILSAGFYWYANRADIAYSQQRPFILCKPPVVPAREDCSSFVTNCHYAGGAPDPNGRGFDAEGYTGTLMSRGSRVTLDQMLPGDLVFYGFTTSPSPAFWYGAPTHVALFTGYQGAMPMVLSNGAHPMGYLPLFGLGLGVNHYRHYHVA